MAGVESETRRHGIRRIRVERAQVDLGPYLDRREMYLDYIDACAGLTDDERRRFQQEYPETSKAVEGIVTRARNDGMRRGRVEGMRAVLERQMRRRFGPLADEVAAKLDQASADELETWAENVLDADTPHGVFDPVRSAGNGP